mgnify:CR=1 FL=1
MAEEEKVYVSNATNPLKKVMMCSPRYYQFNGINVITAEWMKKGDQERTTSWLPSGRCWWMRSKTTVSKWSKWRRAPSSR